MPTNRQMDKENLLCVHRFIDMCLYINIKGNIALHLKGFEYYNNINDPGR